MAQVKTGNSAIVNARAAYVLELARGCSHIGSTLTPDTRERAIAEVLVEFRELYGERELVLFQKLLIEDLQRRGKWDAVVAVAADSFKFIANEPD
ncbi:hypothetical protein [Paraburkholderia sp. D1E]|uniref:hypothetical protein n=1 Tax=Paraburkholderia sp. D1E TaxID=3461398 RepID=UPI004045B4AD